MTIPSMIPKQRIPSPGAHEEDPVRAVDAVVALELGEGDEAEHGVDHDRAQSRARKLLEQARRNSIVRRTKPALMSEAICDRCPAVSATDVFERLPSGAKPPTRPAAPHAMPCAISSWLASIS